MELEAETKASLTAAYIKLDALDIEGFLTFMTDDITYRFGKLAHGTGKPNIEKALKHLHDGVIALQHHFLNAYQTGNILLVEAEVSYTKANQRGITLTGLISLRKEKGLIQDIKIYMDFTPLYS